MPSPKIVESGIKYIFSTLPDFGSTILSVDSSNWPVPSYNFPL